MDMPDETLLEDWQGLESETERLLIVYGYPTEGDISILQQETNPETEALISERQAYDSTFI
jgi:hypothetical protein